ncbi:unnamed protein product [Cochlearia groenlandica]
MSESNESLADDQEVIADDCVTQSHAQAVGVQAKSTPGEKANLPHENSCARDSKPAWGNNQYLYPPPPPPPAYHVPPYAFYSYYPNPSAFAAESSYENHFQAPPLPPVVPSPREDFGMPWQHHHSSFVDPRNMPQGAGPMNGMRLPPYISSAPWFLGQAGPRFPELVYNYPVTPPQFAPYPVNHGPRVPSPEGLRARIRRQIEYYFSDENLKKDSYLKSLMDDQGWVPTKTIATFRRVRSMTGDLELIASALGYSKLVEVQCERMRQRNEWRKWVRASKRTVIEEKIGDSFEESSLAEKRNVDVLLNDLSKTILLDNEIDVEREIPRKSRPSVSERSKDEDNAIDVDVVVDDDDQDVQRLVIVTQSGDDIRINETITNAENHSEDESPSK